MENLPTPLSRVELYLAKACGMDVTVPEEPMSRLEQFLAIIAGDDSIEMPTPMSLTEQWLAYVLGVTPDPLLAVEGACLIGAQKVDVRYFAVAAGMPGATLPDAPQNRAEMYWAHIAVNPPTPGILKYITGKYFYLTDVVRGIKELQYVKGDTYQQTYTGTQLYNMADTINVGSNVTVDADGWITASYDNTSGASTHYENYFTGLLQLQTNTDYGAILEVKTVNGTGRITCVSNHAQSQFQTQNYYYLNGIAAANIYAATVTTKTDFAGCTSSLRTTMSWSAGESGSITFRLSLLADTSITPETFVYQPYTGDIPAPNPDYPQDVQVVTGAQTVTIGDGGTSRDYTLDLGSIELCKIGTYQDYIYKSGQDWYVHKDIGKVDIVSSGIAAFNTHSGSHITVNYNGANIERLSAPAVTNVSNRFIGCTSTQTWGGTVLNGVSQGTNNNYLQFSLPSSVATTQAEARTYFDNHPTTVYYTLSSPTDTKITDATLISQLKALNSATLPKPIANITVGATGTNLTPYLTIAYYGSDE